MTTLPIDLLEHARQHFEQRLRLSLADLLEPIDSNHPAGYCAKSAGAYQAIQHARRSDDPTLPQGPWQHERKRADWVAVSRTSAETLMRKSKDLQLAAWLLESQVHQFGFAGLAPSLVLIDELIRRFGDALYPQEAGGGSTHRANVLRWINRKLLPVLKQVPITAGGQDADYGWADREAAWHREQHKALPDAEPEGPTQSEVTAAMGQTPAPLCLALQGHLRLAIGAALRLTQTVDECFSGDKPSLATFIALLRQILAAVETELHRRGLMTPTAIAPPVAEDEAIAMDAAGAGELCVPAGNVTADRAHAYAMLEQAAYTLLHTDPHSPAPYLVQRAVQWGRLSTSELYKEVFIRMGGQLNIFELLGLETPQAQAQAE